MCVRCECTAARERAALWSAPRGHEGGTARPWREEHSQLTAHTHAGRAGSLSVSVTADPYGGAGRRPQTRQRRAPGRPKLQKDPAPRRAGPPALGTRTRRRWCAPQGQQGAGDTQKARQAPIRPPAQQSHSHKTRHGPTAGRRDQMIGFPERTRMCSSLSILVFSKSQSRTTKTKGSGEGSVHPGQGDGKAKAGLLPPPGATHRRRGSCQGPAWGAGGAEHPGRVPPQHQNPIFLPWLR